MEGNVYFAIYEVESGAISMVGGGPPGIAGIQSVPAGFALIEAQASIATDYVLDGVVTPRPANPATVDGLTLSNLPVPCTITIDGQEYACGDDTAELSFTQPGVYRVTVSAWPMLDVTFEVSDEDSAQG